MKKQVRFSLEKGDLLPTLLMLPALIMIVFVMIVFMMIVSTTFMVMFM